MQKGDSVDHICLVDNDASHFNKSLQELRDFSSQLFTLLNIVKQLSWPQKTRECTILENTKQCISRAVVAVVEHLGSLSANLDSCLFKTSSISETNRNINSLKLRIATCQQRSHKLTRDKFYLAADFSRHHCRYILPPSMDLAASNVISRDSKDGIEAKTGKEDEFEADEPLFLLTHNCKPSLAGISNSTGDMKNQNKALSPPVLPVRGDGLSILPKSEQLVFQFKEARKPKRNAINWRALHSREMASLIRRGKQRIIA